MQALIKLYWGICTFKVGPERTPPYPVFLLAVAVSFLVFNITTRLLFYKISFSAAVSLAFIALTLFVCTIWLLLLFKNLSNRTYPTLGAFLGQDLFIEALYAPIHFIYLQTAGTGQNGIWVLSFISIMVIQCWDLAIKGAILQKALNIGMIMGVFMALAIRLAVILASYKIMFNSAVVVG